MNLVVDASYAETAHVLAVGFEPLDPIRGGRLAHPVRIDPEGVLPWSPRHPGEPYGPGVARRRWRRARAQRDRVFPRAPLPRIDRHDSGRQILLVQPGVREETAEEEEEGGGLDLRIYDHHRRHVPRRFHVTFDELPKVRHPALFPGAAYDVTPRTTGLRALVTRDGGPLRWARIEARVPVDGPPPEPDLRPVVGRAHGDDRGEFLLLLAPQAAPLGGELESPELPIEVTVYAPPAPLADPELAPPDPYRDLPLEPLDDAAAAAGEARPVEYTENITRVVPFRLGHMISLTEATDFEF